MPKLLEAARWDQTCSPFPLRSQWNTPPRDWHHHYPDEVPPALEYPSLRTEQLLLHSAEQYSQRTAVRYYRTNWTYAELLTRIRQVAGNLQRLGVQGGDRVLMVLPNSPDFVVAWFATHWLGAEVVPANPLLSANELHQLIECCRPRAVIGLDLKLAPVIEATQRCPVESLIVSSLSGHLPFYMRWPYRLKSRFSAESTAGCAARVLSFDELLAPTAPEIDQPLTTDVDQTAVLQPTGGTTGTPKVAILSHANLQANVAQLHVWSGLNPGTEVVLSVLPFFHVFGATVAMLSPLAGGATLLLQARFCPRRICKVMLQRRPNVAPMVPFMFASLCREMERRRRNIKGLEFCFSGASALSSKVRQEFQERTGATIFEGFGLSEASPVTHANPPDDTVRPGTIGLPLPGTDARVVDLETGLCQVARGEVGELIIRGPQVMQGYLNNPEETSRMLRNGWLHTGDLARRDADGFFTLVDRKKDMIISAGLNIYPTEVEEVLAEHSSVAECAVIGTPDELYGEVVTAYVVLAPGQAVNDEELRSHCKKQLAAYKVPRIIEVRDELPKNFLGKVRRIDLRSKAA
jgi:long-chain acyl-CoA synthetase